MVASKRFSLAVLVWGKFHAAGVDRKRYFSNFLSKMSGTDASGEIPYYKDFEVRDAQQKIEFYLSEN